MLLLLLSIVTMSRGVILPWTSKKEMLQRYVELHGHLLIPRGYLDPPSQYQLGRLVYRLRNSKDRLTPEQIADLDQLGFVWQHNKHASKEQTWENWYTLLALYVQEFHHACPTHKECYQGQKLGQWVMQQRVLYERNHKLKAVGKPPAIALERIQKLEKLGFLWKLSTSRREVVVNKQAAVAAAGAVQQAQQQQAPPTPAVGTSLHTAVVNSISKKRPRSTEDDVETPHVVPSSTSSDDPMAPSLVQSPSSLLLFDQDLTALFQDFQQDHLAANDMPSSDFVTAHAGAPQREETTTGITVVSSGSSSSGSSDDDDDEDNSSVDSNASTAPQGNHDQEHVFQMKKQHSRHNKKKPRTTGASFASLPKDSEWERQKEDFIQNFFEF